MKRVREEQDREREGKRGEGGGREDSEGERGSHVGRGDRGRRGVKRGR